MGSAPRAGVRRSLALLEAALPALEAAAAAVPLNATGMHSDAARALHYLRKAIERAEVALLMEVPARERRKAPRRGRGGQLELAP